MNIDISKLINGNVGSITFKGKAEISKELVETTEIKELKDINVTGKIIDLKEYGVEINMDITGVMVLECALTLEDVDYNFSVNVNENISLEEKNVENNSNLLDITDIIWENIVLEIPLRVVKKDAKIKTEGDGWKINLGEEKQIDPRLEKLNELFKEEE